MVNDIPKIAINGFGRIGRLVLRALIELEESDPKYKFEIVAINDITSLEMNAHLFEYDSNHGHFKGHVEIDSQTSEMTVNHHKFKSLAIKYQTKLPRKDLGVDYVIESTGLFTNREALLNHIQAGAKRVILSAPAKTGKDVDLTVVRGVNNDQLSKNHVLISNASCTTNCLAPIIKVLDNAFGVESGLMTTVHSFTNDQRVLDNQHKDVRRARAASESLIPTETGAAKAIGLVLPHLAGKIDGLSIRVPTPNVSLIDVTTRLKTNVTKEVVKEAFKNAAEKETELKGIISYEKKELVSKDFNHTKFSSTVDFPTLMVFEGNTVKVLAFYDNEWGYSNRTAELVFDLWKLDK